MYGQHQGRTSKTLAHRLNTIVESVPTCRGCSLECSQTRSWLPVLFLNFLYPSIRVRTAPPVSVRVRVKVRARQNVVSIFTFRYTTFQSVLVKRSENAYTVDLSTRLGPAVDSGPVTVRPCTHPCSDPPLHQISSCTYYLLQCLFIM